MKTISEKRLKILNETVNYFNLTTRNISIVNNNKCYYYPQHTKTEGCGVGRLIKDKELCKKLDNSPNTGVLEIFSMLPKDLQKLGMFFLNDLQGLHDNAYNWTETGLSISGNISFENLKSKYSV